MSITRSSRIWKHRHGLLIALILCAIAFPAIGSAQNSRPSAANSEAQWVNPAVEHPRVQQCKFTSTAAKSQVSYHIYLPEIYDKQTTRRFPVLYWLHGYRGGTRTIPRLVEYFDSAIRDGKMPPVLVVFPNGCSTSFWCNSKDGKVPMESVVIQELLPDVDKTFRTIASPGGRILEGFSMGGYGAARLGFKYPELFGSISILAGGPLQPDFRVTPPHAGVPERDREFERVYGSDPEYFLQQSPWLLAEKNAKRLAGVNIRQVVGDRDAMLPFNRDLGKRLDDLRVQHTFRTVPDVGHNVQSLLSSLGEDNFEFYRTVLQKISQ